VKAHPTAIVDPGAKIAPDVEIGPYAVIGPHVEVGPGSRVGPHCVITGHTRLGSRNRVYQFCSIGEVPQDKKYADEPTRLEIGDDNTIREFCTFNTGTVQDAGVTRIGNGNWIMAYVHFAHDCQVGNHTIFANNAQLAGHVHVGDYAILGGYTGVHQFCHVGAHAITGVASVVLQDVPPYLTVSGNPARPYGINSEGLKRRGFDASAIAGLQRAYKTLYRSKLTLDEAKRALEGEVGECPPLRPLIEFLAASSRGIVRERADRGRS
jgi:UDP-N-acetylglucosamine acyltransferase